MDRRTHIERVKALLAKTIENGCTEQEAAAALAKAKAMIEVYDISDAELELTKQEKAILTKVGLDKHHIGWSLASGIAKFTNTEVWGQRGRSGGYLAFCGLPVDVELGEFLLKSLTDFVESELVNYLMVTPHEARDKRRLINGFTLGCASRISRRLTELAAPVAPAATAKATASSSSTALVLVQHAAIKAYKDEHNIKLGRGRSSSRATDGAAYAAGREAGNRASLARGIGGGAKGYLN